jgi:hypothetical protein
MLPMIQPTLSISRLPKSPLMRLGACPLSDSRPQRNRIHGPRIAIGESPSGGPGEIAPMARPGGKIGRRRRRCYPTRTFHLQNLGPENFRTVEISNSSSAPNRVQYVASSKWPPQSRATSGDAA